MQGRFATRKDEIANLLMEQDVDGLKRALAIDVLPSIFRQGVARKIAEPAIGVAGIGQCKLATPWSGGGNHQPQRVPDALAGAPARPRNGAGVRDGIGQRHLGSFT